MTIIFLLTCTLIAFTSGIGAVNITAVQNIPYRELNFENLRNLVSEPVEPNGLPEEYKHSYLVPIMYSTMRVECTGALISQIHILVTPTCFSSFVNNALVTSSEGYCASLASRPWGRNFETYPIIKLDVHPDFTMDSSSHKIANAIGVALVGRNDEQTFKVVEAELARGTPARELELAAYGYRSFTGRVFVNPLEIFKKRTKKFTGLKILKWSECKQPVAAYIKLEKTHICTKKLIPHHLSSLPGDILVNGYAVLGLQVRNTLTHGVFTDVREYPQYIKGAKERLLHFHRTET